jgi:hypothetical protein
MILPALFLRILLYCLPFCIIINYNASTALIKRLSVRGIWRREYTLEPLSASKISARPDSELTPFLFKKKKEKEEKEEENLHHGRYAEV